MAWNYSGDPSTSLKDQVRFLIGDTDTTRQIHSDEEVLWALEQNGDNVYGAALELVDAVIAKYSGSMSRTVGSLSINKAEIAQNYKTLRPQLRRKYVLSSGAEVVITQEDDTVYVFKDMHTIEPTQAARPYQGQGD